MVLDILAGAAPAPIIAHALVALWLQSAQQEQQQRPLSQGKPTLRQVQAGPPRPGTAGGGAAARAGAAAVARAAAASAAEAAAGPYKPPSAVPAKRPTRRAALEVGLPLLWQDSTNVACYVRV